jgi:phosphotransferase system HPr (HPr) family protein
MRCYTARVTAPNGLHARPCAMLTMIQNLYFPKDEIILVNSETKNETPLNSIIGVMMLSISSGCQLEFVTAMDEETFQDLADVLSSLSIIPATDQQGRPDADYDPCKAVSERKGDRKQLIARLRAEASIANRRPLFPRLGENPQVKSPARVAPFPDHSSLEEPIRNQVFISYSHLDLVFVQTHLVSLLRSAGFDPWFAVDSIRGADRWERSILEGLQRSYWFLVVMSPNAITSEWVRLEVHWASEHRQGRIIPIMISDCNLWQVHMRLGSLQYIDFQFELEAARNKLLSTLNRSA